MDISLEDQLQLIMFGEEVYTNNNTSSLSINKKFLQSIEKKEKAEDIYNSLIKVIGSNNLNDINASSIIWLSNFLTANNINDQHIKTSNLLNTYQHIITNNGYTKDINDLIKSFIDVYFYHIENTNPLNNIEKFGYTSSIVSNTIIFLHGYILQDKQAQKQLIDGVERLYDKHPDVIQNFIDDLDKRNTQVPYLIYSKINSDNIKNNNFFKKRVVYNFKKSIQHTIDSNARKATQTLSFIDKDLKIVDLDDDFKKILSDSFIKHTSIFNHRKFLSSYIKTLKNIETSNLDKDEISYFIPEPNTLMTFVFNIYDTAMVPGNKQCFLEIIEKGYTDKEKDIIASKILDESINLISSSSISSYDLGKKFSFIKSILKSDELIEHFKKSKKSNLRYKQISYSLSHHSDNIKNKLKTSTFNKFYNFLKKDLDEGHEVFGILYCLSKTVGVDNQFDFDTNKLNIPKYLGKQKHSTPVINTFYQHWKEISDKSKILKSIKEVKTKAPDKKIRKI